MTLGDLLTELRVNILHDRSDLINSLPLGSTGDTDLLWSDATLIRYINEAQKRMARHAYLLRDNVTPEATQINLIANQNLYNMHSSVFAVLSARFTTPSDGSAGDTADLARAGHATLDNYHVPDTYFFDPSSLSALPPGKVLAFTTDEGIVQDDQGTYTGMIFRTYPAPDTSPSHLGIIQLRVLRKPLYDLQNMNDVPEIPEEHHMDMLDWAAHLALRIIDVDAGMPDRAEEFRQSFESKVKEARNHMMRKLFVPSTWGFGRNGFSWEIN